MSPSPLHTAGSRQPHNGNFWLQFSAHQAVRSHSPRGMRRLPQAIAFIHNDVTQTPKVNENLTPITVLYPRKASPQGARADCSTYLCTLPCQGRLKRGNMVKGWASVFPCLGGGHGAV